MAAAWRIGIRGRTFDPDAEYWRLNINVNRALDICREIWFTAGIDFPVNLFAEAPTANLMAARLFDGSALQPQEYLRVRAGDESRPLFLLTGGTGMILEYTDFVHALEYPGAVYVIPVLGTDRRSAYSGSFREEAERTAALIRRVQYTGPYRLIGYSSGGCVALETARVFRENGATVSFLGLLDTGLTDQHWPFWQWVSYTVPEILDSVKRRLFRSRRPPPETPTHSRPDIMPGRLGTRYELRFRDPHKPEYPRHTPYWRSDVTPLDALTRSHSLRMWGLYEPAPYDGQVTFFLARSANPVSCSPTGYWRRYLSDIEWVPVPGTHITMMVGRYVARLSAEVSKRLNAGP